MHLQIDEPVARDLVEHVIEERHATGEISLAGAVEVDGHLDLRFERVETDATAPMSTR